MKVSTLLLCAFAALVAATEIVPKVNIIGLGDVAKRGMDDMRENEVKSPHEQKKNNYEDALRKHSAEARVLASNLNRGSILVGYPHKKRWICPADLDQDAVNDEQVDIRVAGKRSQEDGNDGGDTVDTGAKPGNVERDYVRPEAIVFSENGVAERTVEPRDASDEDYQGQNDNGDNEDGKDDDDYKDGDDESDGDEDEADDDQDNGSGISERYIEPRDASEDENDGDYIPSPLGRGRHKPSIDERDFIRAGAVVSSKDQLGPSVVARDDHADSEKDKEDLPLCRRTCSNHDECCWADVAVFVALKETAAVPMCAS
ncbi:hypothetical protein BDV29DRAFT_161157 [Aspergillus leporis]|uniref:Uncharacterized protein n=1 Tax=Aspergillus leporis TaxID=41062 RepID=A0A5N5WRK1_9EURO|nr:hypothetical protein BDV29DRAFT_161157 [Aspergillus leporis]